MHENNILMVAAEPEEAEARNEVLAELKHLKKSSWSNEAWLEGLSARLMHLEKRAMTKCLLGHEMVRLFSVDVTSFCPPPKGEWAWLLRKQYDTSIYGLSVMRCHYFDAAAS